MNGVTREWVAKAEADLRTARRERAAADEPNYDAVCFHSQQYIEKLTKAVLIHRGIEPPRTHDLVHLYSLLPGQSTLLPAVQAGLEVLSSAAVAVRYPGESADAQDADDALAVCERLGDSPHSLLC